MLRKFTFILLFLCSFQVFLEAQDYACSQPKYQETVEFYTKALGYVADSNENKAIPVLKRITATDTAFAEAWYLLGKLYHFKAIVSQYDMVLSANSAYYFRKSEKCFLKSVILCNQVDNYNAYFYMGENMFMNKQYDLAKVYLNKFKEYNKTSELAISKANEYLYNCYEWDEWRDTANVADYELLYNVNTSEDEKQAIISKDGIYIIYKNLNKRSRGGSIYDKPTEEWAYSYVSGVDSSNTLVYSPKYNRITIPGDSECHAILPYSGSSKALLTTEPKQKNGKHEPNSVDIFDATFDNKRFSDYKGIPKVNAANSFEGYPTLTGDEKEMYFVSNRASGLGGMDIFVSKTDDIGNWQRPVNLGEVINTVNDEINPVISADGNHLFFASDGHFGLGGFDIFVSHKTDTGWSRPENLGKPVNSYNDDKNFTFSGLETTALFARKYLKPDGGYDIFTTGLSKYIEPAGKSIITGIVLDHNNKVLPGVWVSIIDMVSKEEVPLVFDVFTGRFSAYVPRSDNRYLFSISKEGYSFTDKVLTTSPDKEAYYKTINMFPVRAGEKFELSGVEFEKHSSAFKGATVVILSDFINFMIENPGLKIMVNGRMANVDDLKTKLSERRAKAVRDYLIENGIEEDRLKYQGFSSSTGKNHSFIEFEIISVN